MKPTYKFKTSNHYVYSKKLLFKEVLAGAVA